MGLFNKNGTDTANGELEQPATTTQSRKSRGMLRRRSKGESREDGEDLSPETDTGSQSKSKGWLSRKSKDKALPPPPPQPIARTSAEQSTPAAKKKGAKRNWIGRKQKNGSTEDDTALNQADIVQEAPKPPPRIRTPEEIAAGLERQKAAVNAIRNTPEKRAATRAMAPVEIPSATTSNAYSTAPVDRSGANRADRSGGKLKGMFKGKGPSIPGFKSKRNAGSPSDNAVVSSAPVEVTPEIDGGNGINDGAGANTALAPETKKGGKFKGMFKRGSGKAKIASPARDLPARSSLGQAGAPHEVELSDQAELSDEPVLNDESATSYSDHAPAQHQQQLPAGYSGITTQEYAPVLPQNASGTGNNQLESTGYANAHEARGHYTDGSGAYDQEEQRGPSGYNPRGGTGGHVHSNGVNSYNNGGQGRASKYRQQAGQYHDDDGEEDDGAGQLDSGDWERINRTWNKA